MVSREKPFLIRFTINNDKAEIIYLIFGTWKMILFCVSFCFIYYLFKLYVPILSLVIFHWKAWIFRFPLKIYWFFVTSALFHFNITLFRKLQFDSVEVANIATTTFEWKNIQNLCTNHNQFIKSINNCKNTEKNIQIFIE